MQVTYETIGIGDSARWRAILSFKDTVIEDYRDVCLGSFAYDRGADIWTWEVDPEWAAHCPVSLWDQAVPIEQHALRDAKSVLEKRLFVDLVGDLEWTNVPKPGTR